MLSLEESLRPFWLKGLYSVTGSSPRGLARWLEKRDFIFQSVTSETEFTVKILDPNKAAQAIAHDATKMAASAFETFVGVSETSKLPRSCGWILIRSYYGAFFAAHALLRMFGTICFQIEPAQKNALDKEAGLSGHLPATGFEGGFYFCEIDLVSNELKFEKSAASKKGSHEIFWDLFYKTLRSHSNTLLARAAGYTNAALFLNDLADLLSQSGMNNGAWLSQIRNSVNYRHELGVWFPYHGLNVRARDLTRITGQWVIHPDRMKLKYPKSIVEQHVALCTALTALCNLVVNDMNAAAHSANGFHTYGAIALKKLAGVKN